MAERDRGSQRVVVTGLGLCTGLAPTREESWQRLGAGLHGFRAVETAGSSLLAGCPLEVPSPLHAAGLVAREAVADAGLLSADGRLATGLDHDRIATVFGMSKGDVRRLGHLMVERMRPGGGEALEDWLAAWPSAGSTLLQAMFDARGPSLVPVAACATGLVAALRAADLVRTGACDVALAGAADGSIDPLMLGAFRKMGVLARLDPGDDPGRAVRPWDRERTGFLVGEGAAVLVLERADHAAARGALPYGELAGGAFGADAFHLTALNPDPTHLAGLIGHALRRSSVEPAEIDHVNVHGTATLTNDPLECQALRRALGRHAGSVSCSANKAQVGHCLGAAGAVELAFTVLALRDGFVPPTCNLECPDPLCDLDATPGVGRRRDLRAALKLSLGFGGHLAVAVLRRWDGARRQSSVAVGGS